MPVDTQTAHTPGASVPLYFIQLLIHNIQRHTHTVYTSTTLPIFRSNTYIRTYTQHSYHPRCLTSIGLPSNRHSQRTLMSIAHLGHTLGPCSSPSLTLIVFPYLTHVPGSPPQISLCRISANSCCLVRVSVYSQINCVAIVSTTLTLPD